MSVAGRSCFAPQCQGESEQKGVGGECVSRIFEGAMSVAGRSCFATQCHGESEQKGVGGECVSRISEGAMSVAGISCFALPLVRNCTVAFCWICKLCLWSSFGLLDWAANTNYLPALLLVSFFFFF